MGAAPWAGAADRAKEEKREGGDKILFSSPTESISVKPLTERDLGPRPFSFQRDDLDAQSQLGSSMSTLPSPDQVNRARVLQELIERSALLYSRDGGDSLDVEEDPLRPRSGDADLGLEDVKAMRERPSGRFPGSSDNAESGTDRQDRTGPGREQGRDRDRDRDRDRLGMRLDDMRGVASSAGEGLESGLNGSMDTTGRGGEDRFLPTFDLSGRDDRRGMGEERRDREGRSRSSELGRDGSRSEYGNRDSAETRRADGLTSFRSLISGGGRASEVAAPGARGAVGTLGMGNLLGVGAGGSLFGGAPAANRSLSEALDARGATETVVNSPVDGLDGARTPVLPSRPVDLGLNVGRDTSSRRMDALRPELAPPPSAMELFQRKHDTRLPGRAF
ncbi:MAG: hypothetical protein IT580_15730 [Verrucomicrobiales bacterium]|nr:hypothetical protein [Verrucomicrobiales bacterium]